MTTAELYAAAGREETTLDAIKAHVATLRTLTVAELVVVARSVCVYGLKTKGAILAAIANSIGHRLLLQSRAACYSC